MGWRWLNGSDGPRGSWDHIGLFRPRVTSSNLIKQVLGTQSVRWCLKDQVSHTRAEISPHHRPGTTGHWLRDLQPQAFILQGLNRLTSSTETLWEVMAPEDMLSWVFAGDRAPRWEC